MIKKENFTLEKCLLRLFGAWCAVNAVTMLFSQESFTVNTYAQDTLIPVYLLCILLTVAALSAVDIFLPSLRIDGKFLLAAVVLMTFKLAAEKTAERVLANGVQTPTSDYTYYFFVFLLIALVAVLMFYLVKNRWLEIPRFSVNNLAAYIAIGFCATFFIVIVGTIGVLRYRTYSAPNFDFGIFCNMFHNMRETLKPLVTCERDAAMSHFSVHISPIYYILLPFYAIFPSPLTLQIGQAVVLASGVIPIYFLGKKYRLKNLYIILISAAYVLYPALSGGTFYDLHENCFLTPLLLWMFFFFEKEKYIPMWIFAAMTLAVKEDAAIYIAFFALYMILGRKKYIRGAATFVAACAYFCFAVFVLTKFGDGVMTGRYSNYMPNDSGFVGMIKTVILNPGYVFSEMAAPNQLPIKLLYLLLMFVPLGFLPVMTKKISRYILLFPMLLMSLMTQYTYAPEIRFQYQFGVTAFLFYLAIMNVSEMRELSRKVIVGISAFASALLFSVWTMPLFGMYNTRWEEGAELYGEMDEILETIDPDASVTCSTMLLAHLAQRGEIYQIDGYYTDEPILTDYVVIDARYSAVSVMYKYSALGYTVEAEYPGKIIIMKKQ